MEFHSRNFRLFLHDSRGIAGQQVFVRLVLCKNIKNVQCTATRGNLMKDALQSSQVRPVSSAQGSYTQQYDAQKAFRAPI